MNKTQERLVKEIDQNMSSMLARDAMWGGPLAAALQFIQALEFRVMVTSPSVKPRAVLDAYVKFMRRKHPGSPTIYSRDLQHPPQNPTKRGALWKALLAQLAEFRVKVVTMFPPEDG